MGGFLLIMPYNIGDKLNNRYWSGENYGWQSKATHEKLKEEGKFRTGTQAIDRVVSSGINWATQNAPGVVSAVNAGLKTVGGAVNFTVEQLNKSATGQAVVSTAGAVLETYDQAIEAVSEATNIDKRVTGFATDLAIGALTGGSGTAAKLSTQAATGVAKTLKKGVSFVDDVLPPPTGLVPAMAGDANFRLPSNRAAQGVGLPSYEQPLFSIVNEGASIKFRPTRVGKQFPEVAPAASQHIDEAYEYIKAKKSTDPTKPLLGYPNFVDPEGEQWVLRLKGQLKDGTPRVAFTPLKEKQVSADKRRVRDVPSSSLERFERAQFMEAHRSTKALMGEDLIAQLAGFKPYIEHGRRLNSPYWTSARARGAKPGDPDNLFHEFDPKFKKFKDSAERLLDQTPNSPIDIYMDSETGELIVENIVTGKKLGYLDEFKPIKDQLQQFINKASD